MAIYDDNVGLESFMQKAVRISQHLSACHPIETMHVSPSFIHRPHQLPVLQYQSRCNWTLLVSHELSVPDV